MPRGPRGEKRPADLIGNAIMVAKIATGEIEEENAPDGPRTAAGKKGGRARAAILTKKERTEIARNAARARWQKN